MTVLTHPVRLSILGIVAGVVAIPIGVLLLLFLVEKLIVR